MKVAWTHDSVNNKTSDWYTPPWIFEKLGVEFDLDPASPIGGVPWIPAKKHYSLEDDGLKRSWHGSVWLNPPYGKETGSWLQAMNQHKNGIVLVFARTDTKWYHEFLTKADAILFLKGRIKFIDGLNKTGKSGAGSGSLLAAWGEKHIKALSKNKALGHLVVNKTDWSTWAGLV